MPYQIYANSATAKAANEQFAINNGCDPLTTPQYYWEVCNPSTLECCLLMAQTLEQMNIDIAEVEALGFECDPDPVIVPNEPPIPPE